MYPIDEQLIKFNRSGQKLIPEGFVIHDTDDEGATAQNEFSYFNSGDRQASAHYFVDWTQIVRAIPENERVWHAGPTANSKYLSVEMCVPKTHDPAKFQEVWDRTVWLIADAFTRYGWSTGPDLWSHAGISNKYKETDHQDPIAYFKEYGKTFTDFVAEVDVMITQMKNGGTTEEKGDDDVLKQAVLLNTKEDYWAGTDVAVKNGNCAIFVRATDKSVPAEAMSAKTLYVIGGAATGHSNEVLLSGQTKYDTAAAVAKYLG